MANFLTSSVLSCKGLFEVIHRKTSVTEDFWCLLDNVQYMKHREYVKKILHVMQNLQQKHGIPGLPPSQTGSSSR